MVRRMSRDMADAAREAPAKRRGRKIDSLSAATKGLTTSILRLGLRCVNGAAAADLEFGVQGLLPAWNTFAASDRCAFAMRSRWRARARRNPPFGAGRFAQGLGESVACTDASDAVRCRTGVTILQPSACAMSLQFKSLYRALCLAALAEPALAGGGLDAKVTPSDCRPRDADSTCATAVAGAPVAGPTIPVTGDGVLYDGPLGGVPARGYAYWGFDFIADASGAPSPVRPDEFINRSSVPVTIKLTFNFPTGRPCGKDCLPGVQFQTGPGWRILGPLYTVSGDTAWVSETFAPGQGYGWSIGLWDSWNTRLTVTVPKGAITTLEEVGLSPSPALANEIPAVDATCACWDGTSARCSLGNHYSNGLLGPWYVGLDNYIRAGAYNECPPER